MRAKTLTDGPRYFKTATTNKKTPNIRIQMIFYDSPLGPSLFMNICFTYFSPPNRFVNNQDGNEWAQREKKRKAKLSPSTRIQWMVLRGRWQLPIWNGWNGKGRFVIVVHWLAHEQYNVQSIFPFSCFLLLSTFSLSFFVVVVVVRKRIWLYRLVWMGMPFK